MRFWARTLLGLEPFGIAESKKRVNANICACSHRQFFFDTDILTPDGLCLRSVDDLYIFCGYVNGIERRRESLKAFKANLDEKAIKNAARFSLHTKGITKITGCIVVASFLGKRNFNRYDVENELGPMLAGCLATGFVPSTVAAVDSDVCFRVHIENDRAFLGVRLFAKPLHRRMYKQDSIPGTIHPPLAFSMAMLASCTEGMLVYDPFCGSGTIVAETQLLYSGLRVLGSDINDYALKSAARNLSNAGCMPLLFQSDAAEVPLDSGAADRIICNLPWSRVVDFSGQLETGLHSFWRETSRILDVGGRIIMLDKSPESYVAGLDSAGLSIRFRRQLAVFGQHPLLCVITRENDRSSVLNNSTFGRLTVDDCTFSNL